jgi:hypothetical protein
VRDGDRRDFDPHLHREIALLQKPTGPLDHEIDVAPVVEIEVRPDAGQTAQAEAGAAPDRWNVLRRSSRA